MVGGAARGGGARPPALGGSGMRSRMSPLPDVIRCVWVTSEECYDDTIITLYTKVLINN